jgi:hypothetical protein
MNEQTNRVEVGRMALRVEGDFWVAYYAKEQTSMEGAIKLGSIRMRFVSGDADAKQSFIGLMSAVMSQTIEDATGQAPEWGEPKPAPEHERAGRS